MVTELTFRNGYASQRAIYDERYEDGRYDRRSAVHVLTAERQALRHATNRALKSKPRTRTISLFDFGYGTGRVTNEFIGSYVNRYSALGKDLRVVAYDVSSAGLMKAKAVLCSKGFTADGPITWAPEDTAGYIAGGVSKRKAGVTITVVFVHGNEDQHPEVMRRLALEANGGGKYLLTTSWYSGLGHIPGERLRREYFHQLGKLTARRGEMVISVSSTGDLAELQPEFSERLANGITGDFPIQAPGDLVYETELGQSNFYHVFGIELNNNMRAITGWGQHWWVEGIRYPGEEFTSREAERANYRRVLKANESKCDRTWDAVDFQEFHTVAAFRSPLTPKKWQ
jgi:SAM-dependent methyltransferase